VSTTELVAIVVVVILAVAAVGWWAGQRRRSERLRDTFGPEYERTVEQVGDPKKAEADLEARKERVDSLEIRTLSGPDRARFGERWRVVQSLFVDDPSMAVQEADDLIGAVMRARGYPVGDFEQRAADISVNHPQVVDHYRTAHRIAERRATGHVDTEVLRQAFVHYRALFAELLETDEAHRTADPAANLSRAADMRAAQRADERDGRAEVVMTEQPANVAAAIRRGRASEAPTDTEQPVEPARRP
jgi:hypothetical protein